jgi:hypothetical protein
MGLLGEYKMAKTPLYDECQTILQELRFGSGHVLVVVIVPSNDRYNKPIENQSKWCDDGMNLLAQLFGGATAFEAKAGIFMSKRNKPLYDKPYLLESYVARQDAEDEDKLKKLVDFLKNMGEETNQEAVGVVIDDTFHLIRKFTKS